MQIPIHPKTYTRKRTLHQCENTINGVKCNNLFRANINEKFCHRCKGLRYQNRLHRLKQAYTPETSRNKKFKSTFLTEQNVEFLCTCGNPYRIIVYPGEDIYPGRCEKHRQKD